MSKIEQAYNCLIFGQGGQGATFLAQLISEAAFKEGKYAFLRPEYQTGILGGNIEIFLYIDKEKNELNWSSRTYNVFINLHYNFTPPHPELSKNCIYLDSTQLKAREKSREYGFSIGANCYLLGILLANTNICSPQTVAWLLIQKHGDKNKFELNKNLELLKLGLSDNTWKTFMT